MLEGIKVSKKYRDFELKELSFSMQGGYLTGLIGENGSGKTTLLRILAGLEERFDGDFTVDGKSFRSFPLEVKDAVAYISEENSFFWEKNAAENGELLGHYYSRWSRQVYREWLERLSLAENQPLSELSKGNRMKFQIAFAMAHEPSVFLMDEPTAGFDPVFRIEFRRVLQEILDEKRCILMSTHITSDLDKIADEIMVMDNGEILCKENRELLEEAIKTRQAGQLHVGDLIRGGRG